MCNEQICSVLLTKDQIDLTRTLTDYLEDEKAVGSTVPKTIYKQYKFTVPVVL